MSSHRQDKMESLLRQEISRILSRDFFYEGALVTITGVATNDALSTAEVGVSIMPDGKKEEILKELKKFQGDFQRQLIKKLNMRFVPTINFVIDDGPANSANVDKLLNSQ